MAVIINERSKSGIVILGNGRIARAISCYLKKNRPGYKVTLLTKGGNEIKECALIIGALAGSLGQDCLKLALRYKKPLIDVSDLDAEFYLKRKTRIEKSGITVIAGCGFSPGLINLILGKEFSRYPDIREIEVKAGSLSPNKSFFPFLWCFEDLILEHQIPSRQIIKGKKKKLPPFAGFQKEKFFGIEAESYLCASGFENLLEKPELKSFQCRVVRPDGFMTFFNFLQNQGFLKKENLMLSKKILETRKEDNFTLSEIVLLTKNKKIIWRLKSHSRKEEKLNSMQKITAVVPALIAKKLLDNEIKPSGLVFMEDLGRNKLIFDSVLSGLRKEGIAIVRNQTSNIKIYNKNQDEKYFRIILNFSLYF